MIKVFLIMGTRIAGEHKEAGEVVEVEKKLAKFLIGTQKGEEYDADKHKPKRKAAK